MCGTNFIFWCRGALERLWRSELTLRKFLTVDWSHEGTITEAKNDNCTRSWYELIQFGHVPIVRQVSSTLTFLNALYTNNRELNSTKDLISSLFRPISNHGRENERLRGNDRWKNIRTHCRSLKTHSWKTMTTRFDPRAWNGDLVKPDELGRFKKFSSGISAPSPSPLVNKNLRQYGNLTRGKTTRRILCRM